jgi:hypothetical protein
MSHTIRFQNTETNHLGDYIRAAAARGLPLIERDSHTEARGAVVCGLGGSLQKPSVLRQVRAKAKAGWRVFALKEAIGFLREKNIPVHYSVNMDPTTREVPRTPVHEGVTYCLASSCHPELYDSIISQGGDARVYHSACGYTKIKFDPGFVMELTDQQKSIVLGNFVYATDDGCEFCPVAVGVVDEVAHYRELFGNGDTMCGGFTVGNRAVALAHYMGFPHILAAGLDFGWRDGGTYYAEFCKAEPLRDVFMHDDGKVDGRPWHTRPDLLASAVDLARKARRGMVTIIGDSLAASLAKRDDEYLDRVAVVS